MTSPSSPTHVSVVLTAVLCTALLLSAAGGVSGAFNVNKNCSNVPQPSNSLKSDCVNKFSKSREFLNLALDRTEAMCICNGGTKASCTFTATAAEGTCISEKCIVVEANWQRAVFASAARLYPAECAADADGSMLHINALLAQAKDHGDVAACEAWLCTVSSASALCNDSSTLLSMCSSMSINGASSGDGLPVGAIAGGVVGGVVFIAIVVGAFMYIRRRQQQHPDTATPDGAVAMGTVNAPKTLQQPLV